ncbi:transcriptional regulator [Jannaschia pagri]|uniref:Transcriptional regulator n=1 Tax=Jannaschia pagri TaxID=2829797 RepID=A0ABQ4NN02_9RHOB|nr:MULTISPECIES: sulfurtransferase TusA family protein [unclassified Jannaschia]GIT91954.1 transcriptional regulator [Jannaschia sp. AI_61]GIT95788.1 transcriptional regulator [Jannaschia sp. AI_62]
MDDPIDLEVDALGLLCPLPVLRLRKRMETLPSGARIRLLADDPAAHVDVPHFCAEAGHTFEGATETSFTLRKG